LHLRLYTKYSVEHIINFEKQVMGISDKKMIALMKPLIENFDTNKM